MLGLYGCALLKEMGFKTVYCSGYFETTRNELVKKFGAIPIQNGSFLNLNISKFNQFI